MPDRGTWLAHVHRGLRVLHFVCVNGVGRVL